MASGRVLAEVVLAAVDSRKGKAFAQFFATDGSFVFGNAEPVIGPAAIAASNDQFFAMIAGLSHAIQDVWEAGRTVIVRATVTYTRKNGSQVSLPCTSVWQGDASGKIADYRVYMDITPVFA